ncbi:MAG: hypothetical protein ACT4O9_03420 [Blastocatellia bacterium]
MSDLVTRYDVSEKDLTRGRRMKIGAVAAPAALSLIPAILFTILFVLFGASPPAAVTVLFFGVVFTVIGFVLGLIISGVLAYRHSKWTKEMRERIAADGIKANEVDWFRNELRSNEKRALKEIGRNDLLLADAYTETLASRLTASRVIKTSGRELSLTKRRHAKLRSLKTESSEKFLQTIAKDEEKLSSIHAEAKQMLIEAESRLQMIEAAALRGGNIVDSEFALKRLSARAKELPLALEEATMAEQIRQELEEGQDIN